ncbi:CDK-activating kinase assembly factor MAT1 [Nosema bombycis CQ1]|uniref:CDK-activating kinase assembly factor MAT1 n=1 Tax=Nosema bombycis (strain CQ1 / CVCC 102059) TaxID=578461 RepID=R0MGM1_NOSB1|nr:CDK-activating kinase assembly factor MAT1 [Nosema bombycis CQ1]|eukprot:EOB13270.1 CDK-activating kinase assembly factor MAT1 [Nosema bombycis CQ1]
MSDSQCPICKTDSYLNPELVLYISSCFHKICENCLNRYFSSGMSKCLECGVELRKINYITSTFEDIEVEKECKIRRQLDRYFSREESDFDNEELYNDYLEKLEDLVFDLLEYKSESSIKAKINTVLNDEKNFLNYKKIKIEPIKSEEKRFKIEEPTSYLTEFKKEIVLVKNFIRPSRSGGLSKEYLLSYLINGI